jgi:hypothetical protein
MRRIALTCALAGGLLLSVGAATASAASVVQLATFPSASQLLIQGEADVDTIGVSVSGGTITITDTGPGGITTPPGPCTAIPTDTVTCPLNPPGAGPIFLLSVFLGASNDTYVNQNFVVPFSQVGGDAGGDELQTGPGNDVAFGGDGNDRLLTGAGDDTLLGDSGSDEMNGGPGTDMADFSQFLTAVSVSFDGLGNDGSPGEGDNVLGIESVAGTQFDDTLRGDDNANELDGNSGDDVIVGRRGSDDLIGDRGDDRLTGGASADGARDHLDCGGGFDIALADTRDLVEPGCERRGARIASDSAKLGRGSSVRVRVACPAEEAVSCSGKLFVLLNGKRQSKKARFKVRAGKTKSETLRLTKAGRVALRRAGGSLLVAVRAKTVEPGGTTASEARVLLTG